MSAGHANRETSAADRFAALAVRSGISLGVLHSSNVGEFCVVLAAAACAFPAGREWTEREVNDILRDWLAGAGAMLAVDHVELRRWLVDFRVLSRDGYGRVYKTGDPAPDIALPAAALAGIDLAAFAREVRSRDAQRRAERKARWLDTKQDAGD